MRRGIAAILIAVLLSAAACDHGPQPKNTVLDFVQALRTNQPVELENYLDLNELVQENSVYTYDSALTISGNLHKFAELFAPDGATRRLWIEKQIVVGETEVRGDTAFVEVSFLDRASRTQYYNKWGLRRSDTGWLIFAFKLL